MDKPKNDPKFAWLKWIVDFLNSELPPPDRAERLYLYLGLERFALHSQFGPPVGKKETDEGWLPKTYKIAFPADIWERASLIQQKFKEFLSPVVSVEEIDFEPQREYETKLMG